MSYLVFMGHRNATGSCSKISKDEETGKERRDLISSLKTCACPAGSEGRLTDGMRTLSRSPDSPCTVASVANPGRLLAALPEPWEPFKNSDCEFKITTTT
ncbi:hypothetical protein AVEN_234158-1 [Araneus ventricosus]|uniref:Uncharacterized protein n=1 Tax=Araneus ventricosus TaxID=182803 RepID=A0A4Y2WR41_ARAVE|nr:hypothetical protein AVEN_234158-1 [Araneus ventricosus]